MILFFLSFFLVSCEGLDIHYPKNFKLERRLQTEKVKNRALRKIREKYPVLKLAVIGGGGVTNFHNITFYFDCKELKSVSEARKMLVDVCEITLGEVNANKKLRPYLSNYPFKARNLDIAIFFAGQYGEGKLYCVNQINDRVDFESKNYTKVSVTHSWVFLTESYDEAKKKVAKTLVQNTN